jgi:hypothetical protein
MSAFRVGAGALRSEAGHACRLDVPKSSWSFEKEPPEPVVGPSRFPPCAFMNEAG